MKCRSCGADNPSSAVACGHCNSHLPLSGESEKQAVFARIKSSGEYADRESPQRHARLPKPSTLHKAMLTVFFIVFIGGSAVMCVFAVGMAGVFGIFGSQVGDGFGAAIGLVPLLMALMPLGFVVGGFFLMRQMRKKMHAVEHDPVQAIPVVVVDKRTHVSGGSGDSSTSTQYFITCENEDGERNEYLVWDGKLYGRVQADDAGILFVRAGYGLDFDRVSV